MKDHRQTLVLVFALAVLAAAASAARGDAPKPEPAKLAPWTAEDILLAESASQWDVSPDGKWAVWVRSRMDKDKNGRVSNLFLTNLETRKEVQLTRGTEMNGQPRWSPDGGTIAFTSSRPLPKPNPDAARAQLWLLALPGGEPYPATDTARGVQSYKWVDSDTIVFSAPEDPALYEQELKQKKDSSRVVDDVAHEPPVRLYRLSLKDRKIARLTDNTDFIQAWDVTPDGKHALTVHAQYLSFEWDQKILPKTFVYDLVKGERREILAGERIPPVGVESARDGSGFYFAAPHSTDPRFFTASVLLVYFHDLATGRTAKVDLDWENGLGDGLRATPDGFLALLADGFRFRAARYVKNGAGWKRTDLEGEHVRNLFGFAVSEDAKTIVYDYSTPSLPGQWYRAKLDGAKLTGAEKLTDLNPDFKARTPARTEILRWKGALGEEVEGLLYYPKDYQAGRKYPLLTAPHGGPAGADMDMWDESWAYAHQLICQRGAFILKPNYHGSSNYGLRFVESICCGHYYDYPVEDIQKGVDLLVAKGLVDPERVGTFGWSNGSILSIELGVVDPDRYKVVCAGAGDVEWISDWANVDFGQSFDTYYFGKSPLEDPQLYLRLSPLYKLDRVKAPTIIFFGTEDRNVPTSQGWIHYRALYHLGKVPVKFILFPGEPHGLQEYAHQMRKLDEEMAWLDAHFFKTLAAANEAFKKDSPLGQALRRRGIARVGSRYGVAAAAGGPLVPEAVRRGALEVGRFEVTRAQYAAFDPSFAVAPGTENFPANGVSFEKAKAYAAWLAKLTGRAWRLPTEEEASSLAEGAAVENTLDYWAGYAMNPDDARRLEAKVRELGGGAPLLKEAGSFAGAGKDDEALLYDLGGNVAEWAVAKDGSGKAIGGSADRPADPKARAVQASAEYIGFRVVCGADK